MKGWPILVKPTPFVWQLTRRWGEHFHRPDSQYSVIWTVTPHWGISSQWTSRWRENFSRFEIQHKFDRNSSKIHKAQYGSWLSVRFGYFQLPRHQKRSAAYKVMRNMFLALPSDTFVPVIIVPPDFSRPYPYFAPARARNTRSELRPGRLSRNPPVPSHLRAGRPRTIAKIYTRSHESVSARIKNRSADVPVGAGTRYVRSGHYTPIPLGDMWLVQPILSQSRTSYPAAFRVYSCSPEILCRLR